MGEAFQTMKGREALPVELVRTHELARTILAAIEELTHLHERKFTLDGHTLGSLGEVLARHMFGLQLVDPSTQGYDAEDPVTGRKVEIKLVGAQSKGISFYCDSGGVLDPADGKRMQACPDHIICMQLAPESPALVRVIFNAPHARIRHLLTGKAAKNGQRRITLTRLHEVQASVPVDEQLPMVER